MYLFDGRQGYMLANDREPDPLNIEQSHHLDCYCCRSNNLGDGEDDSTCLRYLMFQSPRFVVESSVKGNGPSMEQDSQVFKVIPLFPSKVVGFPLIPLDPTLVSPVYSTLPAVLRVSES